jgi:hypothetical protein
MNVKVFGHGSGFDPCKGANRVQNAKVKTMEITRHDGTTFSDERARCRWCKRWLSFDLIPGEAKRAEHRRFLADYYSDNPSEKCQKIAAKARAEHKALVEAPCWKCHSEAELGHPLKFATLLKVIDIGAGFTTNLCENCEVEIAVTLIKAD